MGSISCAGLTATASVRATQYTRAARCRFDHRNQLSNVFRATLCDCIWKGYDPVLTVEGHVFHLNVAIMKGIFEVDQFESVQIRNGPLVESS